MSFLHHDTIHKRVKGANEKYINIMGASSSSLSLDMTPETLDNLKEELLIKCKEILVNHPGNRCCKYVVEYLASEEGKSMSNEGELSQSKLH